MPDDLPAYSHHVPENELGRLPGFECREELRWRGGVGRLDIAPNQRCSLGVKSTHTELRPPTSGCLLAYQIHCTEIDQAAICIDSCCHCGESVTVTIHWLHGDTIYICFNPFGGCSVQAQSGQPGSVHNNR